jgi:hypothetical protein
MSNDREHEEDRQRALAKRATDPQRGDASSLEAQYTPGTPGCHEALHVANLAVRLIENELCQHGAIISNADWYRRARRAQDELAALYQEIGAAHLAKPNSR